jgi:large subunit ribosomal protein L30
MPETDKPALKIRWVRSGTGFSRKQKEIIRSLGLRRLQQVVERPDSAQVRGLVAKVPHLVEVVDDLPRAATGSLPEYVILPPEVAGTTKPAPEPAVQPTATDEPESAE